MTLPRTAPAGLMLVLLVFGSVTASHRESDLDRVQDSWRWVNFSTESGLPSNRILGIVETPSGRVWVSTDRGVAWYDQFRWHHIADRRLDFDLGAGQLVASSDESVYVLSRGSLFRVTPTEVRAQSIDRKWGPLRVQTIASDFDGGLYFTARAKTEEKLTLHRYHSGRITAIPVEAPILSGAPVWTGRSGSLWLTTTRGLEEYSNGWRVVIETSSMEGQVTPLDLVELSSGRVLTYLRNPVGLRGLWDISDGVPTRVLEGFDEVSSITETLDREVLLLHRSGHLVRKPDDGQSWLLNLPAYLPDPSFVRVRSNGDLWVATSAGLFLSRLSVQRWNRWHHEPASAHSRILEILQARDGTVWLGTAAGVEIRTPGQPLRRVEQIGDLQLRDVTALGEDIDGHIWIGSGSGFHGAFRWDGQEWQHFGAREGLTDEPIHRIRLDYWKRLWFLSLSSNWQDLTLGPGTFVLEKGEFSHWGRNQGLLSGRVYDFASTRESSWFATGTGISRFQAGTWRHWTEESGLLAGRIFALAIGDSGRVWFADQLNGLGYLDQNGHPRYLSVRDGLVDDRVWEIETGHEGSVWIATSGGLSRYFKGAFANFTKSSGLHNLEIWPILPQASRVLIGTAAGVTELLLEEDRNPPPLIQMVTAAAGSNSLEATWRVFPHSGEQSPALIPTRYRVGERPWSKWSPHTRARLENLPYGTHQIQVQAANLFGLRMRTLESEAFELSPPYYLNPLTYIPIVLLAFVVLGASATAIVRKRKHTRELRQSESRYRALVEISPEAILVHDKKQVFYANPAAVNLFAAESDEEIRQRPLADFTHHDSKTTLEQLFSPDQEDRFSSQPIDAIARRLDDRPVQVDLVSGAFTFNGQVVRQTLLRDVSSRRKLEEQLRQGQKMEALGRLAGGVAHDFNNLLTVIQGHCQLLSEECQGASYLEVHLNEIEASTERAAGLTRQLLTFSRKQVVAPACISLNETVEASSQMLARLIGEDIQLTIDLAPQLPSVRADSGQMGQVILNLAVNARDAMPHGGQLEIRTENRESDVVLTVRDTGCGIPEKVLNKIFEPFYTTKGPGHGTGLGLSMVYGIIEKAHGRIEVSSQEGLGSTFQIFLPADHGPLLTESMNCSTSKGGVETILLVEDDPPVRRLAVTFLKRRGYTVIEAANPEEALETAREVAKIDLLVTDVVLPGMSGSRLARHFLQERPGTRVLFVSGYTEDEMLRHGVREANAPLLQKPFSSEALTTKVRQILDERIN